MTATAEFRLVPLEKLRAHEQYDEAGVLDLVTEIRAKGVFADPIWVARGSYAILNGHHRVEALKRLGAHRVPAWVLDYESDLVSLEPWSPGPPIAKAEVVARAKSGRLFPPKSTRHRLSTELPARPMPLTDLLEPARRPASHRPASPPAEGASARSG